ncbi:MAG TPA: Mur ligase domain-containing protein [Candidatus Saccharimonadales bacterium]|nr:Mur ligase domain-containing protein [Candidatus Saccharimonadales bacterium]
MHVYFSGIGGTGIGPLALIAHKAGFTVSGSDKQDSSYFTYLREHGINNIHAGQSYEQIAAVHAKQPIDWLVFSSAIVKEQAEPEELRFCKEHGIKATKRDEFLNALLEQKHQKLIAIAGTHGKTTTTAMTIWLCKQLGIAESHSVAAKSSFADMGEFNPSGEYFIYETDEYDRNFLSFHPRLSIITGIDWDHPDVFPSREDYYAAFRQFLDQSDTAVIWDTDLERLQLQPNERLLQINQTDPGIAKGLQLPGLVNRQNAWTVAQAMSHLLNKPVESLLPHLNTFPGIGRRFEQIVPHIYSDYAHTPPKIRGALQMAHELAGNKVVVVYEGLHNTRQHFIKDELTNLFDDVKHLYIVPSYLAREDTSLKLLSPTDLAQLLNSQAQSHTTPSQLDATLKHSIRQHADNGDLVLCISAGGGNSLDEWLRHEFTN